MPLPVRSRTSRGRVAHPEPAHRVRLVLRPADAEPAVLAELPDDAAELGALVLAGARAQSFPDLRREDAREVRAQLVAQGALFLVIGDAHRRTLVETGYVPAPAHEGRRAAVHDEFGAGATDLGMTEGACGGDLLFAEALLARGSRLELRLPFDERTFLHESVDFEKAPSSMPDRWHERFVAVKNRARVIDMPTALGPTPEGEDPFERCNLWMLEDALAIGGRNVRKRFRRHCAVDQSFSSSSGTALNRSATRP